MARVLASDGDPQRGIVPALRRRARWRGLLLTLSFLASPALALAQMPTEPVSLGDGRVVLGARRHRDLCQRRPRLLQLHRLRIQRAPQLPRRPHGRIPRQLRGCSSSASCAWITAIGCSRSRCSPASGRGRHAASTFRSDAFRPPSVPSGESAYGDQRTADRDAARLSVPDVAPARRAAGARPTISSGCAVAAGWRRIRLGNRTQDRGLPFVNSVRWDTGVQVHGVNGMIEWTGAVTTGSLSNPRVDDDNDGRQVAGRVVLRPAPALRLARRWRAARI